MTAGPTANRKTSRRPVLWAAAAIALAGLAAYANSLSGPFVFDDPSSISANPTIRHLWPPWAPLKTPSVSVTVQGRPMLNLSLAINYAISGYNVWSYHALNVLIHILAGLTLFGITRRTLQNGALARRSPPGGEGGARRPKPGEGGPHSVDRTASSATFLAFAVALLWTVHPLQTEAVTYVIQRAESMMGLFYLLTLYCFIRMIDKSDGTKAWRLPPPDRSGSRQAFVIPWGVLAILACLCGMATKEVMISAPIIVLLYDRTFVAGSFRAAWQQRRAFYLGLASTWILLGYLVISGGGDRNGTIGFGVKVAWWAYGLTQFQAIAHYLRMVFWPVPLVFEYGTFWVHRFGPVIWGALLVVPLVAATLVALRRWPAWGFLGFWFFSILAPTSLVPGTTQMIVEHRMYLALAPVLVAIVCGGNALTRRGFGLAWLAVLLPLAGACIAVTAARNEDYRTEVGLWTDTVTKRPDNALARTMFGQALDRAGLIKEALEQFQVSVSYDPLFAMSQENLGEILFRLGRTAEAKARYEEALRLKPDYADAHDNYGVALAREGRFAEAQAHIRQAIEIKADYTEAYYNLAGVLASTGKGPEAVTQYEAALRLKPDYPAAHYNLANTLVDLGRASEAIAHYEAALRLQPNYPEAHYNLGNALAILHRPADAIPHYAAAVRLKPNYPEAESNWGSALFDTGHLDEAKAHYEEALRLDPSFLEAKENLARLRDYRRQHGLSD